MSENHDSNNQNNNEEERFVKEIGKARAAEGHRSKAFSGSGSEAVNHTDESPAVSTDHLNIDSPKGDLKNLKTTEGGTTAKFGLQQPSGSTVQRPIIPGKEGLLNEQSHDDLNSPGSQDMGEREQDQFHTQMKPRMNRTPVGMVSTTEQKTGKVRTDYSIAFENGNNAVNKERQESPQNAVGGYRFTANQVVPQAKPQGSAAGFGVKTFFWGSVATGGIVTSIPFLEIIFG